MINGFAWGSRTYIMGVLNITPDSFSGDGLMAGEDSVPKALEQARQFIEDGAHILDIGAESSRPGSQPISAAEELDRTLPVLEAVVSAVPDAVISIDTYKSGVAAKCLESGAGWINDIWGLRADRKLADVIAAHQAVVVLMHNRSSTDLVLDYGDLGSSYAGAEYADLIADIKAGLEASIRIAQKAGIKDENIILDAGIGFGKTVEQNLEIINRLDEFSKIGFPVLIGPSRKSFIGKTLNLPVGEREEGTAAAVAVGIARGADIVRVHDVKAMARVAAMTDAIVR